MNDLPATVLSYVPGGDFNNKNAVPGIDISFFDPNTASTMVGKNSTKRMIVQVLFDQPLSKQEVYKFYSFSQGNWLDADKAFFASKTVKDLWYIK